MFVRYLAVVFGPGLIGWAIGGPAGFAEGLGAGLVLLGLTSWLAPNTAEPDHRCWCGQSTESGPDNPASSRAE